MSSDDDDDTDVPTPRRRDHPRFLRPVVLCDGAQQLVSAPHKKRAAHYRVPDQRSSRLRRHHPANKKRPTAVERQPDFSSSDTDDDNEAARTNLSATLTSSLDNKSCNNPLVYFERQTSAMCGLHTINNLLVPHGWATVTAEHVHAYAGDMVQRARREDVPLQLADITSPSGNYESELLLCLLASVGCRGERMKTVGENSVEETKRLFRILQDDPDSARTTGGQILGFMVGNGQHWWALRRLDVGVWQVADSMNSAPYPLLDTNAVQTWLGSKCTFFLVTTTDSDGGRRR